MNKVGEWTERKMVQISLEAWNRFNYNKFKTGKPIGKQIEEFALTLPKSPPLPTIKE